MRPRLATLLTWAALALLGLLLLVLACSLWFPVTKGIAALVLLACGEPVEYNFVKELLSFWR